MAGGQQNGQGGDAMWLWGAEAFAQQHLRRLLPPLLLSLTSFCCQTQPALHFC